MSLRFAELDYSQAQIVKDKDQLIPPNITSYIAEFDSKLSSTEIVSDKSWKARNEKIQNIC